MSIAAVLDGDGWGGTVRVTHLPNFSFLLDMNGLEILRECTAS